MGWSQKGKEVGFSCMGKILPTKKDWRTGIRDLTTMSQFLAEKTWWRWLMGKEELWGQIWRLKYARAVEE
nr:hypothetical protein Q903MT_gene2779 [Picea sitchensis]